MFAIHHQAALVTLMSTVSALEVAPRSPCALICANFARLNTSDPATSFTRTEDVVCDDGELFGNTSTSRGRQWRSCMSCLEISLFVNTFFQESDTFWFMFNMKLSVARCALGFSIETNPVVNVSQERCFDACRPIEGAISDGLLNSQLDTQYQICESGSGAYARNYGRCRDCLRNVTSTQTLANYVHALGAACEQRPEVGEAIELDFDVMNITTVNATAVFGDESQETFYNTGKMAGLVLILAFLGISSALAGVLIFWRRRRRNGGRNDAWVIKRPAANGRRPATPPSTSSLMGRSRLQNPHPSSLALSTSRSSKSQRARTANPVARSHQAVQAEPPPSNPLRSNGSVDMFKAVVLTEEQLPEPNWSPSEQQVEAIRKASPPQFAGVRAINSVVVELM